MVKKISNYGSVRIGLLNFTIDENNQTMGFCLFLRRGRTLSKKIRKGTRNHKMVTVKFSVS